MQTGRHRGPGKPAGLVLIWIWESYNDAGERDSDRSVWRPVSPSPDLDSDHVPSAAPTPGRPPVRTDAVAWPGDVDRRGGASRLRHGSGSCAPAGISDAMGSHPRVPSANAGEARSWHELRRLRSTGRAEGLDLPLIWRQVAVTVVAKRKAAVAAGQAKQIAKRGRAFHTGPGGDR